jgi:putative ABC transport system permease protein
MFQDLQLAFRNLRKRPGFSLVIVVTLALGIGANSAIFSVVHAVLLSPLPYGGPQRLVVVWGKNDKQNLTQQPVAYANFKDWRAENRVFEELAVVRGESLSLLDRGEPERVSAVRVTTNILNLLGVQPLEGRDFRAEEEDPSKAAVVLISYGLWQRRYAGDRSPVGQSVTLDGRTFTIIGILPDWLKSPGLNVPPGGADVWIPFVPLPSELNRSFSNTRGIGKLKPGVTVAQAQAEMTGIMKRLEQQFPAENTNVGLAIAPLSEALTGNVRLALWMLMAAVGFVLLIACVNVANLLLARTATRRLECAIRTALGAGRWRLLRQQLVECTVLSLAGSVLGVVLAAQAVRLLIQTNSAMPRVDEISINGTVLAFTLVVSLVSAVLFGVVPAMRSSRFAIAETLKQSRKGLDSGMNSRLLHGLAALEVALAVILLTGAGLLIRSFDKVKSVDPGFKPEHVLTFSVPLPQSAYPDHAAQHRFYENALARFNAIPGVQNAALVFRLPLTGFATATFTVQGRPLPPGTDPNADYRTVSYNYFRSVGMRLAQGRDFSEHDTVDTADVVIVNEELARRQWPNESAVGKRLQIALERTRWREVIGVVANAKLSGLDAPTDAAIYVPMSQNSWPNALRTSFIVVRTGLEIAAVTAAVRGELRRIDAALPLTQVRTMNEIVAQSLAQRRFNMLLLVVFAALAAVLATLGIYGVMSFNVAQRMSEMGIRMALGAQGVDVVKLVVFCSAKITAVGVLAGIAGAAALTRLMTRLLFDVSAVDPLVYTAIPVVLAATAILASYLPARRASQVSPVEMLKEE